MVSSFLGSGFKGSQVQGFKALVSEVRSQMSENREPQNIEFRMLNIEGKENFIIQNSLFDIRYSK
jgi:hypothetical protein